VADELLAEGTVWLEAGAARLIVEARESALGVGLFDGRGSFNSELADRFAQTFGLDRVVFEAPSKYSQFAIMDHFGPTVRLGNVRRSPAGEPVYFDFGFLARRPRIHELAYALSWILLRPACAGPVPTAPEAASQHRSACSAESPTSSSVALVASQTSLAERSA